jgi:hypothetical protein
VELSRGLALIEGQVPNSSADGPGQLGIGFLVKVQVQPVASADKH